MAPPPVGRPAPTTTAPKRGPAPSSGKDRTAAANPDNSKGSGPAPPTTDTTAAPAAPPAPDPAALAAAEAAAAAAAAAAAPPPEAAPAPNDPQPVEPLDQSILDALAAANDKPPDNGSKMLIVAGIGLGLFVLGVGAWAWYHRSSRYMPA
jgi:hypothetical protein